MNFNDFSAQPIDASLKLFRGWTLPNERLFNQWYAREAYRGRGEIVDLGCMNGSSTIALASGLAANPRGAGRKIHAFDRFLKTWDTIPGEPLEDIPHLGDFFSRFSENTAPWREHIEAYRGDICSFRWTAGPIEYLLVDLMKSWETAAAVAERFFPSLLDRDALVVHQDFLHFYTPWIHLVMFRLRSSLTPAFEVPESCTIVFRKTGDLDLDACRKAVQFDSVEEKEVNDAFAWSDSIVHKNSKAGLRAAKAMFFYHYAKRGRAMGGDGEQISRWMARAAEEFQGIEPEYRDHKEVIRAGEMISADASASSQPRRTAGSTAYGPQWSAHAFGGAAATLAVAADGVMRVDVGNLSGGPAWHVQLVSPPRAVRAGGTYTVGFRARAAAPRSTTLIAMENLTCAPIGLAQRHELGTEWRQYGADFVATRDDAAARLRFNLGDSVPSVEIADVVFGETGSALSGSMPARPASVPDEAGVARAGGVTNHPPVPDPRDPQAHRAHVLRALIPPGGVGAECGVFKGEFSRALLEQLAPRRLYLIDPWYLMTREWHWGAGDRSTISALCSILRSFEDELVAGRVVLRIDDDLHALSQMPDHHLDWAYVDSTHLYEPTVKELALLRKKVRPGGIIAGHDWQPDPSHRHHGVCKAVLEAEARGELKIVLVDPPTIQWAVRLPG